MAAAAVTPVPVVLVVLAVKPVLVVPVRPMVALVVTVALRGPRVRVRAVRPAAMARRAHAPVELVVSAVPVVGAAMVVPAVSVARATLAV